MCNSFIATHVVINEARTDDQQDGHSVICVILRHIDQDSIDYDTLLYCFLRVSPKSIEITFAFVSWSNTSIDCESVVA